MSALLAQVHYRLKAVIAAAFFALVGIGEWLVNDPATAAMIQQGLPDPWDKFVPGALGVIGAWMVHHFPNSADPSPASTDDAPVTELPDNLSTTMIPTAGH